MSAASAVRMSSPDSARKTQQTRSNAAKLGRNISLYVVLGSTEINSTLHMLYAALYECSVTNCIQHLIIREVFSRWKCVVMNSGK